MTPSDQTRSDLQVLIANIDKAIVDPMLDRREIDRLRRWRRELSEQLADLDRQ